MRAVVFDEFGGVEVLRVADVPVPEPEPGAVRIAVRAAALNHLDLFVRRGLPGIGLPHIGGSDVAGVVDTVGSGVDSVRPGERVVVNPTLSCGSCDWCRRGEDPLCASFRIIGEHVAGGFAEYVVVPAANTYRVPDDYPIEHAAAAPLTFLTAWRGLVGRGRLQAGETVLVTGASGGVAIAGILIAKHLSARVLAITTAANLARVEALGADAVFDREDPDHRKALWQETGRQGVDVVFDSVGQATWHDNIRALGRGGRFVVYGATTGPDAATDIRFVFWKQIEIIGTTMSNRHEFEAAMNLVFSGALEPVIDVVWPLARVRDAHARLERGDQFGKIVLVP